MIQREPYTDKGVTCDRLGRINGYKFSNTHYMPLSEEEIEEAIKIYAEEKLQKTIGGDEE